ncbi:SDR family oxidoreductase [Pontibacter lucknowensis]|uniref:NADP-dependent 3-hydroxy acid dehydrogenase YdfG n=1 Tax=Pontibacter lucknowensis TaxID=1077936 RepID=A0A1N7AVY2_9BACT|nr:SDR family oxidoreductase [Pontibacter lucknowensis]SIR43260.1 NADP-dependent 3-hydroxy acid dehydrogenase YdfG [Pontibacter lucknowensis]
MKLENKIAVVTGVSRGIGLAAVHALLEQGAKVAGWGRTNPDVQHEHFEFVECDVRRADSVQMAYKHTVEHFGGHISVLINNAGLGRSATLEDQDLEEWHLMFDTNVHGLFYCTRLVVPGMKEMGEGHIINISSIAGTTGIEQMSAYCATKHAVRGISHSLYKEVRDYGVKVTCIYPGSVQTNFFDNIDSVTVNDNMMRPEDIASTIVHCLESHANYHHVDIEVRPLMPKGRKQV